MLIECRGMVVFGIDNERKSTDIALEDRERHRQSKHRRDLCRGSPGQRQDGRERCRHGRIMRRQAFENFCRQFRRCNARYCEGVIACNLFARGFNCKKAVRDKPFNVLGCLLAQNAD
jgi:hypothetical protein